MPQCFETLVLVFGVFFLKGPTYVVKLGGENRANLTPNFGTQGEKSGLGWSQIWTQFDGNFRPRLYNEAADLI